jgi:hypothetical protein
VGKMLIDMPDCRRQIILPIISELFHTLSE